MWAQIINVLLGIWLMAAPAVLGYFGAARTNDHIVGPLAASFAIIAISEVTRPARWANVALGLWLLVAPWVLDAERAVVLNSTVVGLLLALCASVQGKIRQHVGGGWGALWESNAAVRRSS